MLIYVGKKYMAMKGKQLSGIVKMSEAAVSKAVERGQALLDKKKLFSELVKC